jgi:hypothetical protein
MSEEKIEKVFHHIMFLTNFIPNKLIIELFLRKQFLQRQPLTLLLSWSSKMFSQCKGSLFL